MSIMQLIWRADATVNVCPSIHCQSSACMALAFSHSKLAKKRPALKILAWVWAALICEMCIRDSHMAVHSNDLIGLVQAGDEHFVPHFLSGIEMCIRDSPRSRPLAAL